MKEPAGGTVMDPVAWGRTRSPGVWVGAVPATTPGTKVTVSRSQGYLCAL